jgi:DNA polymerase-3 subunit alpha
MQFTHLHVHTQFSLLDGAADIKTMMKKAVADQMKAIAITDHGNMFGVFEFVNEAQKQNIKPIVGCEFYVVEDRFKKSFTKDSSDRRYHQLFLAKDETGYKNLSKLCSLGYIDGLYSKWPRIDKELIEKYHEGLIATTCCIGATIPQMILHKGEEEAENEFKWWLDLFGEDYYIELQNHNLEDQKKVNEVLLKFAMKYNVKMIASNDSHYVNKEDANAHDILLCINTGEVKSKPVGDGKGFRFGFPNDEFYFKTQKEMIDLFKHLPQAIDNTNEIVDKITPPKLKRDIMLPDFPLPSPFKDENQYLTHLTFEGAKTRYKNISLEVEERLNLELKIIKDMGFAGYFLVVSDFINAARDLSVMVGPGRGSAAGSAVAYCIGITNIDPLKYNLLFERFLNPERVSMPDIDTDFDDEGRQKVIDYVVEKYGKSKVAQIITFGTMASKSSIKDVARVLDLPLAEANALTKMIPNRLGDKTSFELKDVYEYIDELKQAIKKDDLKSQTLKLAQKLEGSVRNTGIHAAGIIISPKDLTDFIPISTAKDSELYVTQFDGTLIESAGMLKMDFLGLKTLSVIKDAISIIKKNREIEIDIDTIDLNDLKTLELYQRGDTVGTFQFESDGMRKYLRDLKPTHIEDLIAMNALYRPGPMDYIPDFINRKHGRQKVEYPHPLLEIILKATNGIMVYQEQIMQTAQIIAGYSLGGADLLRRAMGKKDKEKMAKERVKFVEGAKKINNIEKPKADEIFDIMEKFAEYGFNRSHSAAYSVVAFQTAFLKANYTAEYMAAVLTRNRSNIEDLSFFMDECRRLHISVLGPDINESDYNFSVNAKGEIRFGLGAIKGLGEAATLAILKERENGYYTDMFDLVQRVSAKGINKKSLESLAYSGAFDCFENTHRAQYFTLALGDSLNAIEKAIKQSNARSNSINSLVNSLFDDLPKENLVSIKLPKVEPWGILEKLKYEKEMTGMYFSGHPLDEFDLEVNHLCNITISRIEEYTNKDLKFAGIVTSVSHLVSKNGKPYGAFELEDKTGSRRMNLFGENYLQHKHLLSVGLLLMISGKYSEKRYEEGAYELNINRIILLQDARNEMLNKLTLKININDINDSLINNITNVIKKYPGILPLSILVGDLEGNSIEMKSVNFSIANSSEAIKLLTDDSVIQLQLN